MEISVIASGSNGNCCIVEEKGTSIMIDAGKSIKEIEKRMNKLGKSIENLNAILLTHSHIDHSMSAGAISRRFKIPLYLTSETYKEISGTLHNAEIKRFSAKSHFHINGVAIKPVETSHDVPTCGFVIGNFGIFTDTGIATDGMKESIPNLKGVLLESNHDIDMLINGPYPPYLKYRILSSHGHLNNIVASQLLEDKGKGLSFALLGHLSEINNSPKIAHETFETIVRKKIECAVCSREKETGVWEL
ncbi:MAG: MBL fold metallo-hydrolase [Candidatus Woesearchaeota archaeon]|nr:MBL fold metallo-hydrolase [Candidatus Woesearchaeota archaeon]